MVHTNRIVRPGVVVAAPRFPCCGLHDGRVR